MLLLSATDEMSNLVSGFAVGGASHFLTQAAEAFVLSGGDLFFVFVVAVIATAAAIALALEMMVRAAAVYIIVLMLPMVFAAMVWPARRVWAIRLVELLVALIVSKFVIVAVLSLAGAAYAQSGTDSATRALTAMSLLLLSTFTPWTMLKLLPFTEVAASAGGALRQELPRRPHPQQGSTGGGGQVQPDQSAQTAASGSAGAVIDPVDLVATRLRTQAADAVGFGRANGSSRPTGSAGSNHDASSPAPGADRGADSQAPAPGTGGPASTPAEPASGAPAERLPGMDPIWQAENGAWPPLNLGPGGWGGPTEYAPPGEQSDAALAEPPVDTPEQAAPGDATPGQTLADPRDPLAGGDAGERPTGGQAKTGP
jgi:hypothetical protein